MRTELVSIDTDTVPLDGAYYEPEGMEIKGTVQLLHGNCMNFYFGPPRFLPPILTRQGLACLAYNRRGHDVLSTRDSRELEGGAYQTTAEAIEDNRTAGDWLTAKGHGHPILIGHSNGGVLAVRHAADTPETPALVLLSAHAGGTDIAAKISTAGLWAGEQYDEIAAHARAAVAAGRTRELLILPGWWKIIGAASAIDYLTQVPDLVEEAAKIACPVLFIRGDGEPADIYPAERFRDSCTGSCDVEIIEDCDHFYHGREKFVGSVVADWLNRRI